MVHFYFHIQVIPGHTATDKFVIVFPDEFDAYIGMSMNHFDNKSQTPTTLSAQALLSEQFGLWLIIGSFGLWKALMFSPTPHQHHRYACQQPSRRSHKQLKVGHTDKDEH